MVMQKTNISKLNLNLIRVLDALLIERNVSKAAVKLKLTQPAVSHALNKLREIFDDPILVRTMHGMEVTEKAVSLQEDVTRVMQEINNLFLRTHQFDPIESSHTFKFGLIGEYGDFALIPKLVKWIVKNDSQLKVSGQHFRGQDAINQLIQGEVDVLVGHVAKVPNSFESVVLEKSRFCCLVSKKHPLVKIKKPTLKHYLQYPHIHTSYHDLITRKNMLDAVLSNEGIERDIRLTIDHRSALPLIVQNSDYIMTVSESYANRISKLHNLHMFACPVKLPDIVVKLCWHKRSNSNPALQWLINFFTED